MDIKKEYERWLGNAGIFAFKLGYLLDNTKATMVRLRCGMSLMLTKEPV